jgi:hypothetical protein
MVVDEEFAAKSRVVGIVMGAIGVAVAISILCMLPLTGQIGYYVCLDAIDLLGPILIVRFLPLNLYRSNAPSSDSERPPFAGMAFFFSLAALIMILGYVLIFSLYHGSAPALPRIAGVANEVLGTFLMLGSLTYFGRRKQSASLDRSPA